MYLRIWLTLSCWLSSAAGTRSASGCRPWRTATGSCSDAGWRPAPRSSRGRVEPRDRPCHRFALLFCPIYPRPRLGERKFSGGASSCWAFSSMPWIRVFSQLARFAPFAVPERSLVSFLAETRARTEVPLRVAQARLLDLAAPYFAAHRAAAHHSSVVAGESRQAPDPARAAPPG